MKCSEVNKGGEERVKVLAWTCKGSFNKAITSYCYYMQIKLSKMEEMLPFDFVF